MEFIGESGLKAVVDAVRVAFLAFNGKEHVILGLFVAGELDLVFAAEFLVVADDVHDLAGVDIDAPEDNHVIGAAEDGAVAGEIQAAVAFSGDDAGEVVGPVADERDSFLAEGGDDHFADLAVREAFQGFGITDFDNEAVGPVMQAVMAFAVDGGAGAVHFGHAADIVAGFQPELGFNGETHFFAAGFGAADDLAQFDFVPDAGAVHFLGHKESHGSGGTEAGGAHVLEELQMDLQVAGANGNGHGSEPLAAALESSAGGPQTVAHGHLDPVLGGQAGHFEAAGHLIVEHADVFGGIGQDLPLAGSAAGGVDTHNVLIGHAEKGKGIPPAQIVCVDGRKLRQIVERTDIVGADAGLPEDFSVLGRFFSLMHGPAQAFSLDFEELFVSVRRNKAACHTKIRLLPADPGAVPSSML